MRVQIVTKDTIDLIVSAAVIGNSTVDRDAEEIVRAADRIGRQLRSENYAAANAAAGTHHPTPLYTWQPVFDLIWQPEQREAFTITEEQALQVERCRLFLIDNSADSPNWADSFARKFLDRLGAAIQSRLRAWPLVASDDHPGVVEYSGLCDFTPQWRRGAAVEPTQRIGG